jgi:hypothetical protein
MKFRYVVITVDDPNVTQSVPDTRSVCQSINNIEVRSKQVYVKRWKCLSRSVMSAFTLFLMFDATRWGVPISRCSRFIDMGESGKVSLKSLWQIKQEKDARQVWRWTLGKKTSLQLKCWQTTDGLARASYNVKRLRGLLCSPVWPYCVFINPVAWYWIFNRPCIF